MFVGVIVCTCVFMPMREEVRSPCWVSSLIAFYIIIIIIIIFTAIIII